MSPPPLLRFCGSAEFAEVKAKRQGREHKTVKQIWLALHQKSTEVAIFLWIVLSSTKYYPGFPV